MRKFINKSQTGFSLVELMITVGITGVLSMGIGTLMRDQHVGSKHREARFEMMAVAFDIFEVLQDESSCAASLSGLSVLGGGSQVPTIFQTAASGNTSRFQINDIFGGRDTNSANPVAGQVQISDMRINNFRALGKSPNEGLATFTITFQTGAQNIGANIFTKSIDLQVLQDGADSIVNCQGDDAQMTQIFCDMFNGRLVDGLRCQELAIESSGTAPAITTEGDFQANETSTSTVTGNLQATGSLLFRGNTSVGGQVIANAGNIIGQGDLTMSGETLRGVNEVVARQYCIAGQCKRVWFQNVGCPTGQVLQRITHNPGTFGYVARCRGSTFTKVCGGFGGVSQTFNIDGATAAQMSASPFGFSISPCNFNWSTNNYVF